MLARTSSKPSIWRDTFDDHEITSIPATKLDKPNKRGVLIITPNALVFEWSGRLQSGSHRFALNSLSDLEILEIGNLLRLVINKEPSSPIIFRLKRSHEATGQFIRALANVLNSF